MQEQRVRFYINQANGLKKKMLENHPNLSKAMMNRFAKDMQAKTYVFVYDINKNGEVNSELYDIHNNALKIRQQDCYIRAIIQKCVDFVNQQTEELPSAVTSYRVCKSKY